MLKLKMYFDYVDNGFASKNRHGFRRINFP